MRVPFFSLTNGVLARAFITKEAPKSIQQNKGSTKKYPTKQRKHQKVSNKTKEAPKKIPKIKHHPSSKTKIIPPNADFSKIKREKLNFGAIFSDKSSIQITRIIIMKIFLVRVTMEGCFWHSPCWDRQTQGCTQRSDICKIFEYLQRYRMFANICKYLQG